MSMALTHHNIHNITVFTVLQCEYYQCYIVNVKSSFCCLTFLYDTIQTFVIRLKSTFLSVLISHQNDFGKIM